MIQIKSEREIGLMREAGRILRETRTYLESYIKPGISTLELDKMAEIFILKQGATPAFKGYNDFPGTLCTSVNEEVVHGIPSAKRILKEGDIVTLDIGVTYKGYHADSAKTYPVGEVSQDILKLLEVCEASMYVGIEQAKPGNRVSDISHAIESYVKPYGYGIVRRISPGHGIGRSLP